MIDVTATPALEFNTRPVAAHLGGTAHLSPLLRKARQLGLADPEALFLLAVKRGCVHYAPPDFDISQVTEPGSHCFSDAELAIALISGAQRFHPQRIRCAAQLLGSHHIKPAHLVRLALMERCAPVLCQIAQAGMRFDTEQPGFWEEILRLLPAQPPVREGVLPHPTRYTLQTGIPGPLRHHKTRTLWLRPTPAR